MRILSISKYITWYDKDFYNLLDKEFNLDVAQLKTKRLLDLENNVENKVLKTINLKSFYIYFLKLKDIKKYDVFILEGDPRNLSLLLIISILKIFRKKIIIYSMFHKVGNETIFHHIFYKILYVSSNALISYGKRGAKNIHKNYSNISKIYIAGNGINVRVAENPLTLEDLSLKYNIPVKKYKYLISLVRLSEIKKPFELIDVIKHKDMPLFFIGGGDLEKKCKKYCVDNGLDNIFFLGPIYDENVIKPLTENALANIIYSCPGLSIHHSFHYGCPIITKSEDKFNSSEYEILNKFNSYKFDDSFIDFNYVEKNRDMFRLNCLKTSKHESIIKKVNIFKEAINDLTLYS